MRSVGCASAIAQGEMGSPFDRHPIPDATRFDLVVLDTRSETPATSPMTLLRRNRELRLVAEPVRIAYQLHSASPARSVSWWSKHALGGVSSIAIRLRPPRCSGGSRRSALSDLPRSAGCSVSFGPKARPAH
jgi:hypothetical protein